MGNKLLKIVRSSLYKNKNWIVLTGPYNEQNTTKQLLHFKDFFSICFYWPVCTDIPAGDQYVDSQ